MWALALDTELGIFIQRLEETLPLEILLFMLRILTRSHSDRRSRKYSLEEPTNPLIFILTQQPLKAPLASNSDFPIL
jgi:hypothetical protein